MLLLPRLFYSVTWQLSSVSRWQLLKIPPSPTCPSHLPHIKSHQLPCVLQDTWQLPSRLLSHTPKAISCHVFCRIHGNCPPVSSPTHQKPSVAMCFAGYMATA